MVSERDAIVTALAFTLRSLRRHGRYRKLHIVRCASSQRGHRCPKLDQRRHFSGKVSRLTNHTPNIPRHHDCLVPGRNGPGLYGPGKGRPLATCVVVVSSDESDGFFYLTFSEEA